MAHLNNSTIGTAQSIYKSEQGEKALMELYDRVLEKWEFSFEKIIVPARFGDTFVIAGGNATKPPIVLLHGSGSNSLTWLGDIPQYCTQYRIYALDILGEAGKSAHNRLALTGSAYAEWMDEVLDAFHINKAILIGLSLGGWMALKYTIFKPGRVSKLVLISPGGITSSRFLINLRLVLLSFFGKWGQDRIKQLIFGNQSITADAEQAFDLLNKYYNYRMGDPPLFSDNELKGINIPTFFLGNKKDVFFKTDKAVNRLQRLLPELSIKIFKDKGHGLINTAGDILPFLSST